MSPQRCKSTGCTRRATVKSGHCQKCRSKINARWYAKHRADSAWWEERKRAMRDQRKARELRHDEVSP